MTLDAVRTPVNKRLRDDRLATSAASPRPYRAHDPPSDSAAAFNAICATLPGNINVENKRAPNGDVYVWLDRSTIARLNHMRATGEDYSDVILRLAEASAPLVISRGVSTLRALAAGCPRVRAWTRAVPRGRRRRRRL